MSRVLETVGSIPSRRTKGKSYTVKRDPESGSLSCDCPGWIYSRREPRSCRHTLMFETMLSNETINPGMVALTGEAPGRQLTPEEVDARNLREFSSTRPDFAYEGERSPQEQASATKAALDAAVAQATLREQLRRSLSLMQKLEIGATWESYDNPNTIAQIAIIGRARRRITGDDGEKSRPYIVTVTYNLKGPDGNVLLTVDEEVFRKTFTPRIAETATERKARQVTERLVASAKSVAAGSAAAAQNAKKAETPKKPSSESTVSLLTVRTITFDED